MAAAFADELRKLGGRSFPLSRALSTPLSLVDAVRGGVRGGTVGHTFGGPIGAGAGGVGGALYGLLRGVGDTLGRRRNFAVSTLARLRAGGSGLQRHEKARLAEGLGLAPERMEKIIRGMRRRVPGGDLGQEGRYSRLANSTLNPVAALERFVDARALAGRMGMKAPLLGDEQLLVDALRARARIERMKDVVRPAAQAIGAAGLGTAGYGAYRALEDGTSFRG